MVRQVQERGYQLRGVTPCDGELQAPARGCGDMVLQVAAEVRVHDKVQVRIVFRRPQQAGHVRTAARGQPLHHGLLSEHAVAPARRRLSVVRLDCQGLLGCGIQTPIHPRPKAPVAKLAHHCGIASRLHVHVFFFLYFLVGLLFYFHLFIRI